MWTEFRKFITRGNVIDLAVGIIIGAAFTTVVNSLVNDILMPPIGYALGGVDFTDLFINLSGGEYASLELAQAAGAATINYGLFLNAIINFFIVALAMFMVVSGFNRLMERTRKKEEAEAEAASPAEPTTEERLVASLDRLNANLEKMDSGQ